MEPKNSTKAKRRLNRAIRYSKVGNSSFLRAGDIINIPLSTTHCRLCISRVPIVSRTEQTPYEEREIVEAILRFSEQGFLESRESFENSVLVFVE